MNVVPIACRMDALTAEERRRRSEFLTELTSRMTSVVNIDDGLAFVLSSDGDTPARGSSCARRSRKLVPERVDDRRNSFRNEFFSQVSPRLPVPPCPRRVVRSPVC